MWSYFTLVVVPIKKNVFPHDLLVANILITAAPELFIFTIHALKNKKTITNCHSLLWNNTKIKQKKSKLKQCIMRHSEAVFQGLYPRSTICYNSTTIFTELVRPIFLLLDDFLCCPCDLPIEYFDTQLLRDSFPGFINIFFLCWIKHLVY